MDYCHGNGNGTQPLVLNGSNTHIYGSTCPSCLVVLSLSSTTIVATTNLAKLLSSLARTPALDQSQYGGAHFLG